MITMESLEAQLKKLDFNVNGWGRTEARELVNILHEHEEILELVNGYYDGGFALLVATDIRIMLVDKKPLNYLTVEDLRFEMISEIDYSHRLIGAHVNIAGSSNKTLRFTSLNQQRLRKTIGHVQHAMAMSRKSESEHAQDQKGHLAQINQQLQSYLLAQHQQQQSLQTQLEAVKEGIKAPEEVKIETVKPSHELSDYLFAQSLLAEAKKSHPDLAVPEPNSLASEIIHTASIIQPNVEAVTTVPAEESDAPVEDLYSAGMEEIFGNAQSKSADSGPHNTLDEGERSARASKYGKMLFFPMMGEVNSFRVAYRVTADALKNRKDTASQNRYNPESGVEALPVNPSSALHMTF